MEKNCLLCSGRLDCNKIYKHHLSYDPELTISLCKSCHQIVHLYARYLPNEKRQIDRWIDEYAINWNNGKEKYLKSESRKNQQKDYYLKNKEKFLAQHKTSEAREKRIKHYWENRDFYVAKSKTPKAREYQKLWARKHRQKIKEQVAF